MSLLYPIHEVAPYINWSYFFHAWGFPARFAAIAHIHGCDSCRAAWLASFPVEDRQRAAEAMQLHKEAQRMLVSLDEKDHHTRCRFSLFPCNSDGDDILLWPSSTDKATEAPVRLSFLRQQTSPFLCLSDFIRPLNPEGQRDRIGVFAATADAAIEQSFSDEDDYRHLLCQTLADRLAEATAECAHLSIRKVHWAYAPTESLSMADLHAERYQGIRPAVGYPCLPDQSLNFDLDRLIDFSAIGIHLTENAAMLPHASVSGLMLAHPQAQYFSVGRITEEQFQDYARRRRLSPDRLRPFLAANLNA